MKSITKVVCFFLALGLWACSNDEHKPLYDHTFYPTQIGYYQSYDVSQRIYEINRPMRREFFQVKEVLKDTLRLQNGETAFLVYKYRRKDGNQNWELDSISSLRKNTMYLIKNEFGMDKVNIKFPLLEGKTWNTNIFNTQAIENFVVENVGKPFSTPSNAYSNTVTILQKADSNLVFKDHRFEVFAPQVGMLYRHAQQLSYCSQPNCFGQKVIEKGIISEMYLNDYGIEK